MKEKEADPESAFVLTTINDVDLTTLGTQNITFKASVNKRKSPTDTPVVSEAEIATKHIVKDKSLGGKHRDASYPSKFAFYLYGTPDSLNIDHVIVNSPNIQLSAENVQLHDVPISSEDLVAGAILFIENASERVMQPFQSTIGPEGDLLDKDPTFFFRPEQEFKVSVYKDPTAFDQSGPGLLNISNDNLIGCGTLKLTSTTRRYIDSVTINRDPYEAKDGTEKFKVWKKVFDSIGKELD